MVASSSAVATPPQGGLELDERVGAGHHRHDQRAAAAQRGHHPGVHQELLPDPDGPTTVTNGVAVDPLDEPATSRLVPQNSAASASWKERRPL